MPDRPPEARPHLRDDPRHPGDLRRDHGLRHRQVTEVLDHEDINAVGRERVGFVQRAFEDRFDAAARIARAARQRVELNHADDRLRSRSDHGEKFAHRRVTSLRRPGPS